MKATTARGPVLDAARAGPPVDTAVPFLADDRKLLFIHGEWCAPAGNAWLPTIDPSNGRRIMDVACADAEDIARAARAAHNALFGPWGMMPSAERARLLLDLALAVEAHRDELARIETVDQGKPLAHALGEAEAAAGMLRRLAGFPQRHEGRVLASSPLRHAFVRRERIGVCGLLLSWHRPLFAAARALGAALAAGNTVLLRPAPEAPLAVVRLVELAEEAGFPRGTINLVIGHATVDDAIVAHPLVAKVFLAGSIGAAGAIALQAAARMKPLSVDSSGRSVHVVFADADLAAAATAMTRAAFTQHWHPLAEGSRLFVERPVHGRFTEMLRDAVARLVVGPGIEPRVGVGPLLSRAQRDRAAAALDAATAERLAVLAGGNLIDRPGYFLEPTLIDGVRRDSVLASGDFVGPLLGVTAFDSAQDTMRLATAIGACAGASVWTRDLARAHALPGVLRTGRVWINATHHRSDDLLATCAEFDAYTDPKAVVMNSEPAAY